MTSERLALICRVPDLGGGIDQSDCLHVGRDHSGVLLKPNSGWTGVTAQCLNIVLNKPIQFEICLVACYI